MKDLQKQILAAESNMRDFHVSHARNLNANLPSTPWSSVAQFDRHLDVLFPEFSRKEADSQIRKILALCHQEKRSSYAWCSALTPQYLRQSLRAWGFEYELNGIWMSCSLPKWKSPKLNVKEIKVDLLTNPDIYNRHNHPYFGLMDNNRRKSFEQTFKAESQQTPQRTWHLLAMKDKIPAGAATLHATDKTIGLYNIGVIPSARHLKIGTLIVAAACQLAQQMGFEVATLQCHSSLKKFYGLNGFRPLGFTERWRYLSSLKGGRPQKNSKNSNTVAEDFLNTLINGNLSTARKLLKKHPSLPSSRYSGLGDSTPLHQVAWYGQLSLVKELNRLGANPNAMDSQYHATAAKWAQIAGNHKIAAWLDSKRK